jgi:hypothetical protein
MSYIFIFKCVQEDAHDLEPQNFTYNEYTTLKYLQVLNISMNTNMPYKTVVLIKSTLMFCKH